MKSIGKCLSEKYVLNGIIESHFSDAYAYIFDYMFNFILYNLSLLTLGFLFHHPIAVTIYIIITGSLRAVTGGYHCKTRISCYILSVSYTHLDVYKRQVKCHKENRPVNSVETHDIFSDKVQDVYKRQVSNHWLDTDRNRLL